MLRAMRLVIAMLALTASPALARERLLAPIDEWQLTRSEESCVLRRNFRDPSGAQLRLDIETFAPGEAYKFLMVGNALPLRDGLRRGVGIIRYRFKPDREWRQTGAVTGYADGKDALSFQSDLSTQAETTRRLRLVEKGLPIGLPLYQPDLARAAQVVQFALAYPARDDMVLQLGSMSDPLMQLHGCTRELVADWGYDPVALEAHSGPPVLQNGEEIGTQIGREMRIGSLGQNQAVNFRLDIDREGRVSGCTVQAPRRDNAVEALICRILSEKAVVTPALDGSGNPVAAPLVSRVAFMVSI